mgnify:CR=1 FL=1
MITILLLQVAMGQSVSNPDTLAIPVRDSVSTRPDTTIVHAVAPVVDLPVVPLAPVVVPPPPPPSLPPPPPAPVAGDALPPEPPVVDRFGSWQIGAMAGSAGGYGISLRRWFGEANAVQLNVVPYMHRENIPGTDDPNDRNRSDLDTGFQFEASIVVGLTWLHSYAEKSFCKGRVGMSVLSYVATAADLEVEQQQIDHIVRDPETKARSVVYDDYYRLKREFALGGGGGLEFQWWRLSVTGMLGMEGWYEAVSEDFGFAPDGQLGIHFRF